MLTVSKRNWWVRLAMMALVERKVAPAKAPATAKKGTK